MTNLDRRTHYYKQSKRVLREWTTVLLIGFILLSGIAYMRSPVQEPISPLGAPIVHAQEPVVQAIIEPLNTYNAPQYIVDLIVKYFGDEAQNALKVVGTCENKGWNPQATHQNRNGSWDAGIFQINSIHGYSQEYLFNPENNIKVAKKIFNVRGWKSWSCSHVINITPFYLQGVK